MSDVSAILEALVKINSSNPPGNEKRMVDFIVSFFQGYEHLEIIDHGDNRASLIIEIPGKSKEAIAIIGHLDTVPVADPDNWNYPPFEPTTVGSNMYGRGTSDMKSGLACMISLVKYIIDNKVKPEFTTYFMFTADEESKGMGIRSLVDLNYFAKVKYLLIAEPSDESLIIKEKGALWLKLIVHGKASHGSTPHLGINAIERLFELTQEMRNLVCNGESDELLGESTFAINKVSGGIKTNITAEFCEAELDIRTIPSLSHDTILDDIRASIYKIESKYSGLKIELEVINNRIPMMTREDNPFVTKMKNILNSYQYDINIKGGNFFTDGSIVLTKHSIPFVIYGPGLINQCHVDNEYLSLESLERVLNVYKSLLIGSTHSE